MPDTPAETVHAQTVLAPAAPAETGLAPVLRRTVVHCSAEHAFRVFTDDLSSWWPFELHAVGGVDQIDRVELDGRAGGAVVERWHDGSEHRWAEVVQWEPPTRLVLSWHPGSDAATATEIEVRFDEERAGLTRVTLEHRGWERLGDAAAEVRDRYDGPTGWMTPLNRFKGMADDPAVHRAFGISLNNAVWAALGQEDRRDDDTARMVDAAHASLWHWSRCGTAENLARGEWMCSHVYAVVGRAEPAVHHARRCLAVVEAEGLVDFDRFYAYEGMARALACAGDPEALSWRDRAAASVTEVAEREDREICEGDLAAGPWYGLA